MLYSGKELNHLFNSNLQEGLVVEGISIDTRTIKPGDLFIAIKGRALNGHHYVHQAAQAGAVAVIVDTMMAGLTCSQIVVDDTLKAMEQLGEYARSRSKATIIAITGSVGKTTTKEILKHALAVFGKCECSLASFNNHWGVPLSLARLPADADFGVFEIGMNNPGEIAPLVAMVRPDIAIITAIAPAHIGQMGSMTAIATEKASIYSALTAEGIAIIPNDTEFFDLLSTTTARQIVFGERAGADFRLSDYKQQGVSGQVTVTYGDERLAYTLPRPGKHIATISLIALAVGKALGLDLDKINDQLTTLPEVTRRGQIFDCQIGEGCVTVIDDSYNANLTSMQASMTILANMTPKAGGRRLAVIGEMLELGSVAADHHYQVGQKAAALNLDGVYLVGSDVMSSCRNGMKAHQFYNAVSDAKDLIKILLKDLRNNDIILFKGSNGVKLNTIIEALRARSDSHLTSNAR